MAVRVLIHSALFNKEQLSLKSIFSIDIKGFNVDYYFTEWHEVEPKQNPDGDYNPSPLNINLPAKMNRARKVALEGNYDAILNIEDDTIVPRNVLKELWSAPFDMAGAVYRLRKSKYINTPICGRPKKSTRWVTLDDLNKNEYIECSLVAFGCTLIRRNILEKLPFSMDGNYCMELEKNNFSLGLVSKCQCGHIDRNGEIIWVRDQNLEEFRWLMS